MSSYKPHIWQGTLKETQSSPKTAKLNITSCLHDLYWGLCAIESESSIVPFISWLVVDLWSICIALCAWCGLPVACNPSVRRRSSGGCGGISLTPPTHPPCSTSSFSPSLLHRRSFNRPIRCFYVLLCGLLGRLLFGWVSRWSLGWLISLCLMSRKKLSSIPSRL